MKRSLLVVGGLAFTVVILIPLLIIQAFSLFANDSSRSKPSKAKDTVIRVYLHDQGKIVKMPLEEYLKGVLAAEMPAEFASEALKAQAVAARTYAIKSMAQYGSSGMEAHPGADVSTDFREGQAWISQETMKERWGSNYDKYSQKISQAVDATRGLVITYNGELINAVFHSTSGPRTATAEEVWGFDYPYLHSVACSWDEASPRFSQVQEFSLVDMEQRLGADSGIMAAVQSGVAAPVQVIAQTPSGRVDKIRVGSKVLTGATMREKLGLRSTNFAAVILGDTLRVTTTGYGHGVGLCQYGANGMAKQGSDFRTILSYYYTGVHIE